MTSSAPRLYVLALTILAFFLIWAAVAARPWQAKTSAPADPRLAALQRREQALRRSAVLVQRLVDRRNAEYAAALASRRAAVAAANRRTVATASPVAPRVRVVTLPPLTITRSS